MTRSSLVRISVVLLATIGLTAGTPLFAGNAIAATDPTDFKPGPPACLDRSWFHVNTEEVQTENQWPVTVLRFGDHMYRMQKRFVTPLSNGVPRDWMDACLNVPTQQVLMENKLSTLTLLDGEIAEFKTSTVIHKTGRPWREIRGAINDKYNSLGGYLFAGFPTTSEIQTPNKPGAFNHFDKGFSIYWSPNTGAHKILGAIRDKWASLGWENSFLGFPTTDEFYVGRKRYGNHFQDGSIYWSSSTGAHEVHGSIRDKWGSLGWQNSSLGLPVTDELPTPVKPGRFNHFQGGSIYWSRDTGAHEVRGAIRDKWASLGWENSKLGFPTSDEYGIGNGGRRSRFQNNCDIDWYPEAGATAYCTEAPPF